MGATIPLTLDTAYKLNCVCNARVLASRYRYKICIPHGARTKINYKLSVTLYLAFVKQYNTIYRYIRRGELQYVVHVAVVIVQQIKSQFPGPGRAIVEGQSVQIASSVHTERPQPTGERVAVKIPELDVTITILRDKAGRSHAPCVLIVNHGM